jgi:hypothetical protein
MLVGMDAGLAGLLGGVIGAAVGSLGAIASAVITGSRSERLARLQIQAQTEQAKMQIRASHIQTQVGQQAAAHTQLLDRIQLALSRIDMNPHVRRSALERSATEAISKALIGDFRSINSSMASAVVIGPGRSAEHALESVASFTEVLVAWLRLHSAVARDADTAQELETLNAAISASRDSWSTYALTVRQDLDHDGSRPRHEPPVGE